MRYLLFPMLLFSSPSFAQEHEIIVTGRGLGTAPGDEVLTPVVLGRDQLTGSASGQLDEILKQVPGLQLFRRSDARSANPTSQGVTLRALGGNASSRALLLLDGVPQTDPFGGWISWPAYNPERLASATVTRGGGSGANGPGALAGTIELESVGPRELRGLDAAASVGSRDSFSAGAAAGLNADATYVLISGRHERGDGFIPILKGQRGPADQPSPYEQTSLAVRSITPLGSAELQLNVLLFNDRRERGTAFSSIETDGADASVRLVGPWWSALAYLQTRNFYNSFASVNATRTSATRASEQYEVPSIGKGARLELRPKLGALDLRLGGDWRETDGETRELFNFQNGVGTRSRIAGGQSVTLGSFAEATLNSGAFTISGGARIDHWTIWNGRLLETLIATGGTLTDAQYRDRSGWEPTGRVGVAWSAAPGATIRAAAYSGWRLPTLNELYRPFRVGADATAANPELAPERLKGVETGLEYRASDTASFDITFFANRLSQGIANVTLGNGPALFPGVGFVGAGGEYRQRRNIDAIDVLGLELSGRLQLGSWTLNGGYSFADAKVKAGGEAAPLDGLRPAQTPRHSLSATLGRKWQHGGQLAATLRYVGVQFEDDLNQQILDDAVIVDAVASLPLGRKLSLETRAENLFNELVVAGISNAGVIERATPRTLWLGVRLRH